MQRMILGLLILSLGGCAGKVILRDSNVYQAELEQYHKWATVQAKHLRSFIVENCECESDAEGPQFSDPECEEAAEFVLTIEARADWHKAMSLWNAGLSKEEPNAAPPEIAPLVCPLYGSDEARIESEEAEAERSTPSEGGDNE